MANLKNLFTPLNQKNADAAEALKESALKTQEKSIAMKKDSINFRITVDASKDLDQAKTDGIFNNAVTQQSALLNQAKVNAATQKQLDTLTTNQEYSMIADQETNEHALKALSNAEKHFSSMQEDHYSNSIGYENNLKAAGQASDLATSNEG